jgi:hypothetical protein
MSVLEARRTQHFPGWSSRWCVPVGSGPGWGPIRGIEQHYSRHSEEQGSQEDRGVAEGVVVGDGRAGNQAALGKQDQCNSDDAAGSPPDTPGLGVVEVRGDQFRGSGRRAGISSRGSGLVEVVAGLLVEVGKLGQYGVGVAVLVEEQLHQSQRHPSLLRDLDGVAAAAQHRRGYEHPHAGPVVLVGAPGGGGWSDHDVFRYHRGCAAQRRGDHPRGVTASMTAELGRLTGPRVTANAQLRSR